MTKVYDTADGGNIFDPDARRVVKEEGGKCSNPHYYRDGDSLSKKEAYEKCDEDLEDDDD